MPCAIACRRARDGANAHKTAFLRARLFCLAVPLLQAEVPLALMIMAAQMAVAVIGGLITSTILSLVMVPAVYEMVDDFEQWLSPRLKRFLTPVEAEPGGKE